MSQVRLAAIALPGDADAWRRLGFDAGDDERVAFANGALALGSDVPGLVVESVGDLSDDVDGVPVGRGEVVAGAMHPNGAFELDHVVVMTDSLERTSAAIERGLGLEQRRIRETAAVRQAFHRFPGQGGVRGCIVEVVESERVDRPAVWGIVVNVLDLEEFVHMAGELVGAPKDAVQPGRRIVTVRPEAGLGTAVAVMSTDGV